MDKNNVNILHQNLVDLNQLADHMIKEITHKNNIIKNSFAQKEQYRQQIGIMRGGSNVACKLCAMNGGFDTGCGYCATGGDSGCGYCKMKGGCDCGP